MKVEKDVLLNALDKLSPGLSPKELIQQMTHYNFIGKYIVTYNDLVSVYYPFETDFVCSVKAESFLKVLNKIGEEEVSIDLEAEQVKDDNDEVVAETYFLKVKTETTEADFPVALEGDLTEAILATEQELEGDWESLPSDFAEGAYLCMFSASKDAGKGTLTCLNVNGQNLMCCDQMRATKYEVETEMPEFMIKAGAAKELRSLNVSSYKIGESWVHFRNDDGVIVNIRRIQGEYRDISHLFEDSGTDFLMPPELKEAIDLCGIVNDDMNLMDRQVLLSIESKTAICTANKDGGIRVKKSVPIPFYSGSDLSFLINSEFLSEVIERTPPDEDGQKRPPMKLDFKGRKAFFVNDKFKHIFTLKSMGENQE